MITQCTREAGSQRENKRKNKKTRAFHQDPLSQNRCFVLVLHDLQRWKTSSEGHICSGPFVSQDMRARLLRAQTHALQVPAGLCQAAPFR